MWPGGQVKLQANKMMITVNSQSLNLLQVKLLLAVAIKFGPDDTVQLSLVHWPLRSKNEQQPSENGEVHLISPMLQAALHAKWDINSN